MPKNPIINKIETPGPKSYDIEVPRDKNGLTYSQYEIAKETGSIPEQQGPEEDGEDTYSQYMYRKENPIDENDAKQAAFEEQVRKAVTITDLRIDGSRPFNIASYLVEVPSLGFRVWRKWTDFFWLRNALKQKYEGMFIPSLIPKLKSSATMSIAKRRSRHFVCFLEQVGAHELLRRDEATLTFLGEKNEYEWNKYMKEAKLEPVDWLPDGNLTFTQEQVDTMISNHRNMLAVHEKHLLKLQTNAKALAKASKDVRSAVNKCSKVAQGYADATSKESSAKTIFVSLTTMAGALARWGEKGALEPAVLSEVMVPQISFQLHQVKAFRELLAVRDNALLELDKHQRKLDSHRSSQASGKTETRGSMFGFTKKEDINDAIANSHGTVQSTHANVKFLTRALVESELEKFDNKRTEQYEGIVGMVGIGMIKCEDDVSNVWSDVRSNADGIMEHVKVFIPNFDNFIASNDDDEAE